MHHPVTLQGNELQAFFNRGARENSTGSVGEAVGTGHCKGARAAAFLGASRNHAQLPASARTVHASLGTRAGTLEEDV